MEIELVLNNTSLKLNIESYHFTENGLILIWYNDNNEKVKTYVNKDAYNFFHVVNDVKDDYKKREYRHWSPEEDEYLKAHAHVYPSILAKKMNRTVASINLRRARLRKMQNNKN